MSKQCEICGKTPLKAASLSFSHKQNVYGKYTNKNSSLLIRISLLALLHCLIINYDILSNRHDVSHFYRRFDSERQKEATFC